MVHVRAEPFSRGTLVTRPSGIVLPGDARYASERNRSPGGHLVHVRAKPFSRGTLATRPSETVLPEGVDTLPGETGPELIQSASIQHDAVLCILALAGRTGEPPDLLVRLRHGMRLNAAPMLRLDHQTRCRAGARGRHCANLVAVSPQCFQHESFRPGRSRPSVSRLAASERSLCHQCINGAALSAVTVSLRI